jgi:hypothetical protein
MTERPISEYPFEAVRYVWEDRIARGMLTLVAGRPGGGKGLFVSHLAAHVSQSANVLFSLPENKPRHVVRPRLEVAGADLDRVFYERNWRFPRDLYNLVGIEQAILRTEAQLVVLDPIAAHIDYSDRRNISRGNDRIRLVTDPLEEIAERHDCAIVVTEHTLKNVARGASLLAAILGSGAGFPAAAQTVFVIGKDPDDQTRHVLVEAKGNVEESEPFAFQRKVASLTDQAGVSQTVAWLDPLGQAEFPDPIRMLLRPRENPGPDAEKTAEAAEFLVHYLRSQDGFAEANEATAAALDEGIAVAAARRVDERGGGR